jgi:glycosyltransferase involved in cell wall biosynthesis
MRLLYLHQYFKFPNESGGTRSFDLSKGFSQNGYQLEIVTSTSDIKYKSNERWVSVEKTGLQIHYIYLPYSNNLSYSKRALVFFQFLWYATFKLLSIKCDVVLATSTPLTIGIPALVKKWVSKTPFIFEARDVWPEAVIAIGAMKNKLMQRALYFLEKTIYSNAAAIVSLSTDMQNSIVSRYPEICENKPVVVIENISEIDRFFNVSNPVCLEKVIGFNPRFSILYAGTFGRVNGLDYVINMAEKILKLDSSIVFILLGEGSTKKEVIKFAKEKGVFNKNVFIMDAISKQDLPAWYYSVDIGSSFVIPIKALWANSANKFFDTLAASKPVLINHEGWQAEVIRNDNIGYVLPEIITTEDVKNFVSYTYDTEKAARQKINAFNKAVSSYSLEIATKRYIKIFDQIESAGV